MKKIIFVFVFLLLFFSANSTVNAQAATSNAVGVKQEGEAMKASAAARQARKDALSDAKVAACQQRSANITKRSSGIVTRVTNQITVFTKISQRVEQYYNEKMLPDGKVVVNYNALVSDIATKEAAIAPLLATASADAANFSCDKDRPAEQVLAFNKDMKAVLTALETYRKSVRNLIVAVRTAAGVKDVTATSSAVTR